MIYLDHNATTPVLPAAAKAVAEALSAFGNASSVHACGRDARRRVEDARESVAALVGARPEGVIFTSGGTEANNLALRGTKRRRVLVSAIEHPSVLAARPDIEILPVDAAGLVDVAALVDRLAETVEPALVSVMLANNETGIIQPVAAVAEAAHRAGALVHCDAVQGPGKMALDVAALGVDLLTLSAHKMGGPQGAGALVVADGVGVAAEMRGGGQERRRRAGTENVAAIAGFGVAAQAARAGRDTWARMARLRARLEAGLTDMVPGACIFGAGVARLPNTSCVAVPGMAAETQVMALDLEGVAVSAGSACSSGKVEASHVLAAMGMAPEIARCAIRVSLGWTTGAEDVDAFLAALRKVYGRAAAVAA